ncbi:hypothetical protein ACO0QE_001217 [Hanseniaspora vineae]
METLAVINDDDIKIESFVQIAQTGLLYQIKQNEQTLNKIKESIEFNKLEVAQMSEHFISELNKTEDISEESLVYCKKIADKMGVLESKLKKCIEDFTKNQESLNARLDIFLQLESMQKSGTKPLLFPEWRKNYTTYILLEYLITKNVIKPTDTLLEELTHKGTFNFVQIFQKGLIFDYSDILNSVMENQNLEPVFEFIDYVQKNNSTKEQLEAVKKLETAAHWAKFLQVYDDQGEEQSFHYIRNNIPDLLDEMGSLNVADSITSIILGVSNKAMAPSLNNQEDFETRANVFGIPHIYKIAYEKQTLQDVFQEALESVVKEFKTTFFKIHNLPQVPMLVLHLLLGAAALHSKECHQHSNVIMKLLSKQSPLDLASNLMIKKFIESNYMGTDCPLCDSALHWIKSKIPYSGKPGSNQTFEHDAVKSPSGYVYDKTHFLEFLDEFAKFVEEKHLLPYSNGEEQKPYCIDPMSREPFDLDKLEKVYPS